MKVGVPTEIKTDEYRVSLTPAGVRELTQRGHDVYIESGAGLGSAIKDADYQAQGAEIVPDAQSVFDAAELILGVKEPQAEEVEKLRSEHTLFTYLHLAPAPATPPTPPPTAPPRPGARRRGGSAPPPASRGGRWGARGGPCRCSRR